MNLHENQSHERRWESSLINNKNISMEDEQNCKILFWEIQRALPWNIYSPVDDNVAPIAIIDIMEIWIA